MEGSENVALREIYLVRLTRSLDQLAKVEEESSPYFLVRTFFRGIDLFRFERESLKKGLIRTIFSIYVTLRDMGNKEEEMSLIESYKKETVYA